MIDLSALRALCEQATPGPWRQGNVERYNVFTECRDAECLGTERVLLKMNTWFEHEHDAAFIAISRTALPALIDEVSRLRGEVERMRTVAVKLIECFDDGSLQVDHTDADTDPLRPVPVCGDDHDACSRETCPAVWVVNDAARIIEHRFNGPTAISTARKGEP
jgi:hypothetical protein